MVSTEFDPALESRVAPPRRGSAEALMASHGTWSMDPDEREEIERMIEEERLGERVDAGA